jgi:nucleoid-associated protein YgaU
MPKPIPLPAVIVEPGDTLMKIALAEWGDARRWPILAAANHLKPGEERLIRPGDILVVGGARPLPTPDRQRRYDGGTPWH